jgi:hypothetical protein
MGQWEGGNYKMDELWFFDGKVDENLRKNPKISPSTLAPLKNPELKCQQ